MIKGTMLGKRVIKGKMNTDKKRNLMNLLKNELIFEFGVLFVFVLMYFVVSKRKGRSFQKISLFPLHFNASLSVESSLRF